MIAIGIAEWCLPERGPAAISIAGQLHLQAIHLEFPPCQEGRFTEVAAQIEDCARMADRSGISIAALAMNGLERVGGIHAPQLDRKPACITQIKRGIDAASLVNIPMVYVPSFGLMEIQAESDFRNTIEVLKAACKYAETKGLMLASENTLGPTESTTLVQEISSPVFRVMLDTLNPIHWGHNPVEIISAVKSHLCNQIHAKDSSASLESVPLGSGIGRFRETASSLKAHGFDGVVILENRYTAAFETEIDLDRATVKRCFD